MAENKETLESQEEKKQQDTKETKKVIDTKDIKEETSNTVNKVKDTIKNVDIKKDSIETKSFIVELFKDPLGKINEIVSKDTSKYFKYAIIILIVWTIAVCIKSISSKIGFWGYGPNGFNYILAIVKTTLAPIFGVIVMSVIIFVMNKTNKKELTTIISAVTTTKVPIVIASIISLLTIFSGNISTLTAPFTILCSTISIVLLFFAMKNIFGQEKNSEFIKKFALVEVIYYGIYILISFLGIYI